MAQRHVLEKKWGDETEKLSFLKAIKYVADSRKSTEQLLRDGLHPLLGNHTDSISLIEPPQDSEDALARDTTDSLVACSTVSVSIGDFLGVMPGQLRYLNFQASRNAVPGPCGVWLDTIGYETPFNYMRVAAPGELVNVALCWEAVNENGGSFCDYWRVRVHATKSITPYEPLVRDKFH
jgi:hypothetical protein